MDQLRYLVSKAHKEIHPYGQSIMGLAHALTVNTDNINGYVRKMSKFCCARPPNLILSLQCISVQIGMFGDGHVLVVCMAKEQAERLLNATYFQVDLTFKRVQGDINEFEINQYDEEHHIGIYIQMYL